jgi:hypothetical protein
MSTTVTGDSLENIKNVASNAANQIAKWSESNKLILNPPKTTYLYFKAPKTLNATVPRITLSDQ